MSTPTDWCHKTPLAHFLASPNVVYWIVVGGKQKIFSSVHSPWAAISMVLQWLVVHWSGFGGITAIAKKYFTRFSICLQYFSSMLNADNDICSLTFRDLHKTLSFIVSRNISLLSCAISNFATIIYLWSSAICPRCLAHSSKRNHRVLARHTGEVNPAPYRHWSFCIPISLHSRKKRKNIYANRNISSWMSLHVLLLLALETVFFPGICIFT